MLYLQYKQVDRKMLHVPAKSQRFHFQMTLNTKLYALINEHNKLCGMHCT